MAESAAPPKRRRDHAGQFLPGKAWRGNAAGRPALGFSMTEILAKYLRMPIDMLVPLCVDTSLTAADGIAVVMVTRALDREFGDQARRDLLNRLEGYPRQAVDLVAGSAAEWLAIQSEATAALKGGGNG